MLFTIETKNIQFLEQQNNHILDFRSMKLTANKIYN